MEDYPFLRNEMLWGEEAQRRLARAHVILFGLGGVGSYTAECLARSGVGELTLHPVCELYDAAHRDRFFPEDCRYDYIADAIDLVSCKLDLAQTALRLNIPIAAALGTGNKLDPTLLRIADISQTFGCPLARVMRRELRRRGIAHLDVVFSPEEPAQTVQREAPPPGRRSVPASNPWVPASAGLLLGSLIVRRLIAQTEEATC